MNVTNTSSSTRHHQQRLNVILLMLLLMQLLLLLFPFTRVVIFIYLCFRPTLAAVVVDVVAFVKPQAVDVQLQLNVCRRHFFHFSKSAY